MKRVFEFVYAWWPVLVLTVWLIAFATGCMPMESLEDTSGTSMSIPSARAMMGTGEVYKFTDGRVVCYVYIENGISCVVP